MTPAALGAWGLVAGVAGAALPPVDEPVKTGSRAPAEAAVVVGVEDYFVLPDVPYAARDAAAFYAFLVYTRGIPADRVTLLDRGANREQILKAVKDAGGRTAAGGRVWVYFSGHGAASPDTGERVLLGVDVQSDLDTFRSRSVAVSEVRAAATAGGAEALLVLDTCYSGRGRGGADLVGGKRFAVPSWAGERQARVSEWTAAGPDEWSGPLEPARHGAFTYLVLGALRGWADGQRDGRRDGTVTLEEAHLYVQDGLRALGQNDQRPVLVGDLGWALSSGAEAAPTLTAATVSPPAAAPATQAPATQAPPPPAPAPAPAATHPAPGQPGQILLTSLAVIAITVDGALQNTMDTSGRLVVDGLSPGRHQVRALNLFGKQVAAVDVDVGGGEQVRVQYQAKAFTVIGRGPRVEPALASPEAPALPAPSYAQAPLDTGAAPFGSDGGAGFTPDAATMQGLLVELQQATFPEDQLMMLQSLVIGGFRPSSAQVGQLLDGFPHATHRVQAVRILAPAIVDPQNVERITAHCTFDDEKRQIREAVAAHAGR